ncbi:hypothetical protein OPT61_g5767 [Boeremia exigua]|uniref:Uncharacterized protein n=1 Tax=Boeremia exigua TaxID=749465 RepID=A0ACC2I995_9PLEO|nr:hypothetical protein OPT61_g5767 [Boeremia exigua]
MGGPTQIWTEPTNWYHAFSIIVEVFEHHFAQRIHFAAAAYPKAAPTYAIVQAASSYPQAYVLIIPYAIFFLAKETALLF